MSFDTGWSNQILSTKKFNLEIRVSISDLNSDIKISVVALHSTVRGLSMRKISTAKEKNEDFN